MISKKYVICNDEGLVIISSDHPAFAKQHKTLFSDKTLGNKVKERIERKDLKVGIVCNWDLPCGISTYSKFFVNAMKPIVKEIKIFSEKGESLSVDDSSVVRCWERGKNLRELINKINEFKPDFLIVQHEFGIFPSACHFLNLLQGIDKFSYVVTLHSVYEHQDKTICTASIRNVVVHSQESKAMMSEQGHKNSVFIVPHGCFSSDKGELWNSFQNPYTIIQFGFGFKYKGVDRALEAIALLKKNDLKFKDIFYCYLCSENPHTSAMHSQYVDFLLEKAKELDIIDNVAIIRGYQDEVIIQNYLRTAKIAIFPYVVDPKNTVYGSSGAIRVAMANNIPVIGSESHLFDDLEEVLPRPNSAEKLAKEIDEIFSNNNYRTNILNKIKRHTQIFTWENTAEEYLKVYDKISL